MAKAKDNPDTSAKAASAEIKDNAATIETAKPAADATAKPAAPTIDAIKMVRAAAAKVAPAATAASDTAKPAEPAEPAETEASKPLSIREPRWSLPPHAPLAAGIALAVALGAAAGVAATASMMRNSESETTVATRALQDSVTQLGTDLAALKTGISTSQRAALAQLAKLGERIDHAEKAQAEPNAKLAKLQESVDKLGLRQQQAAAAASDVTGTIPGKDETKIAEGWRLRDFYAGRAVVESSRTGRLYEIGPGTNLPGLGKVESIKRDNGRVVVTTPNGIIAAAIEPRHPPYYPPYRY
jgi:hypothetical protein